MEGNAALEIWFGVFTLLHGLTHFWYAGHSAGRYELSRLLESEVPAARTHCAAQYGVLSHVNSAAIDAPCVLVLRVPIALWRREVPFQQPVKPGMKWPDRSWALSGLIGDRATRRLATYSLVLAGVGFLVAGAGILADRAGWWPPVALGAAALSAVLFCLCWDGRKRNLDGQGLIGIIIDIAILAAALCLW